MSYDDKLVLAVIPARGGSKGIRRKNLMPVNGVTLLDRAVEFASDLDVVDYVCVTTDDIEIANSHPSLSILTPAGYLHSDECRGTDVWAHAWIEIEEELGDTIDLSIYLEPSSPIRTDQDVVAVLAKLSAHRTAATVSDTPKKYSPEKQIIHPDDGRIRFMTGTHVPRRQLIPNYYHLNGVCYAANRSGLIGSESDFFRDCGLVATDHFTVNIDDPHDLQIADWYLRSVENCQS